MVKDRLSLLEGSVAGALLRLSIPIIFANILQSAYQLTDTFWVGRIGPVAVAAVSLSFPVIFLLISLGSGFAISGTVLVAQYAGQRSEERVNQVSGQTFFVTIVISIILSFVGYFISPFLIELMKADPQLVTPATEYLQISFLGLFFVYAYIMFQSLFRGVGNVYSPLVIVAISVLLNFFLDPLFILGWGPIPGYGVNGAAYATILSQGLAAIAGIHLMMRGRSGIHLQLRHMKPIASDIKKIISLGLPASAEQSTRALSMLMVMFIVSSFGIVGTAAYGVGSRVLSFIIIPALGFSMATSTIVGQNIGAGLIDRARRSAEVAVMMILSALTTAGIVLIFAAPLLMEVFVPDSPSVQDEGASFIRIIALTFGMIGVQQVVSGALRGGGSTLIAMLLAMTTLWVFRFPLAYVLSLHTALGVKGVWWAFCVSNMMAAVLSWVILKRSNWLRKVTSDLDPLTKQTIEGTMVGDNVPE